ncbi:S1 family peptidase [Luteimonas kalidii]|uniref:Serine protease n=1 Tax=Luteimonas kalidii TaxID=3042025 RepID=A0ABT6JX92_9GAMM|nr:serine protease [Luteimonas kalidii]MDH5835315.1 serine protease [Luteimonas kalidii]
MPAVRITEDNLALTTLRRSWATAIYSDQDGIGAMGSMHEAGDGLAALVLLEEEGPTVLGSGVMIGPGLAVVATHVLDEFAARSAPPLLLTFLPDGTRAWLPRDRSTASGPSAFGSDRRIVSDVTLLSCTLNSDAHEHHPLTLAPLQVGLPLIGERLWAFGYRHGALQDAVALISPLVTSGLVTAVFPQGRGERMPSACIEVAMDTKGGMSGGPVVNADGDLVGIVSSSIEGGPSYVTLIWELLRLEVHSTLPLLAGRGDIDLFAAQQLGLVKLKGQIKRSRRGDATITLSKAEAELMAVSVELTSMVSSRPSGRFLDDAQLEEFQECWLSEMEKAAADAALVYLEELALASVRGFLAASGVPAECLAPIRAFSVEDFEGLEDLDLLSVWEDEDGTLTASCAFDLLSVVWTVEVPEADYLAKAGDYDAHFINIAIDGPTASMELVQRCHFEAALTLDPEGEWSTQSSITFSGVFHPRLRAPEAGGTPALGHS